MTERWYDPFRQALRSGAFIFAHFAVASFFVATNYLIEWMLRRLGDPKLFDVVPWRYVFDAVDVGLIVVFGIMGVVEAFASFEARMGKILPWPTLGYVRRLILIYAIAWTALGAATLLVLCLWFSPIHSILWMLAAVLSLAAILYPSLYKRRSPSVPGE